MRAIMRGGPQFRRLVRPDRGSGFFSISARPPGHPNLPLRALGCCAAIARPRLGVSRAATTIRCETLIHMADDERNLLTAPEAESTPTDADANAAQPQPTGNEPKVHAEEPKRRKKRKSSRRKKTDSPTWISAVITAAISAISALVTVTLIQQLCQSLVMTYLLIYFISPGVLKFI
jgi:hypothetical protein